MDPPEIFCLLRVDGHPTERRPIDRPIALAKGTLAFDIGSGSRTNQLVLAGPEVAEAHARVTYRRETFHLAVRHPLLVNDRPQTKGWRGSKVELSEGDVVTIGPYRITIHDAEPVTEIEKAFLDAIEKRPDDDATRAVYSDWLEQEGQTDKAAFLRTQLALKEGDGDEKRFRAHSRRLDELAPKMRLKWRRAVARPVIEKCPVRFELVCPKRWDVLQATASPSIRYCTACEKNVHFASSIDEAIKLSADGRCVSVDIIVPRRRKDLVVRRAVRGRVAPR